MLITERFHSIQGEGPLTGLPMFFIRTSRCNLRCIWCDSTYTFDDGTEVKLEDITAECSAAWEDWICLTGGEPLLQRESLTLVKRLASMGKSVLVETGGSLSVREFTEIPGVVIDMDVKTPSSGEQGRIVDKNLQYLRETDYIKFVISDEADYEYAVSFIESNSYTGQAVFQPAYGKDVSWLPERMLQDRLKARYMIQLHKLIWGEVRGK